VKKGSGMPDYVPVDELVRQPGTNKLFAFTHGRSVFVTTSALPVELNNFSGIFQDGIVNLYWETTTEVNNYGFEVERSINMQNKFWKNIGFVAGSGNSNSIKRYTFNDRNSPFSKSVFYRLKQIDTDGAFEYSNIVEIWKTDLVDFVVYQNYPNPFNPSTKINYRIKENSHVKVGIYAITGELISTLINNEQIPGEYSITFDSSTLDRQLASGIYLYRISVENLATSVVSVQTKKMIFVK